MTQAAAKTTPFSIEVCDLFIDALATAAYLNKGEWTSNEPLAIRKVAPCALVNKAWRQRANHHIWSSITIFFGTPSSPRLKHQRRRITELCGILKANPGLKRHIHLLSLRLLPSGLNGLPDSPELLELCALLAPVPHLSITASNLPDLFNNGAPTNRLSQSLSHLCQGERLSKLLINATHVPIQVLEGAPQLQDVKFINVSDVMEGPSANLSRPLPFRLKSAEFVFSNEILVTLLSGSPEVFSGLEKFAVLDVPEGTHRPLIQLLMRESSTLKELSIIDKVHTSSLLLAISQEGLDLRAFANLTKLTVALRGTRVTNLSYWVDFLSNLEGSATPLLPKLQFLNIQIRRAVVRETGLLLHSAGKGWDIARTFLAPEFCPSLNHFAIDLTWASADFDEPEMQGAPKRDAGAYSSVMEALKQCFPSILDNDGREVKVSIWLHCEESFNKMVDNKAVLSNAYHTLPEKPNTNTYSSVHCAVSQA